MAKKLLIVVIILSGLLVVAVVIKKTHLTQIISQHPVLQKYSRQIRLAIGGAETATETPVTATETKHFSLSINAEKTIGPFPKFYVGHGMGTFHDGLIQAHNYEFFKLIGEINRQRTMMKYVNMKCIFMDPPRRGSNDYGAHVVQPDAAGNISYHWEIVDEVIDRILENEMKPIISLTFMPEALASDPNWINPWNRGIISVPKDYDQWRELNYQTILHLKEKYGAEEIETWYFEVWNEPDLFRFFWRKHPDQKKYKDRGDFDEYCKLYDYAVAGAVAAHPNIKIGRPALSGDKLFLAKFLEHCFQGQNYVTRETGSRIDFGSRHNYGEIDERIVPRYLDFMETIRQFAGPDYNKLDIIITETGPSTHPKPWMNNQYMAPWIVREVDAFLQIGDKFGADYLPDVVCFWGKPVSMNFGKQFGLATALGNIRRPDPKTLLKRPAFNAYHAVSLLGDERIELTGATYENSLHGIATRTGDESIEILLYHLREGDTFNTLRGIYTVDLNMLCPQPEYTIEHFVIDEKHSNSYYLWKKTGSPEYPASEVIQQLQAHDDLALAEPAGKVAAVNGAVQKKITMQNNSVAFIRLRRSTDSTPPGKPEQLQTELNWKQRAIHLTWHPPKSGEAAVAYEVYRNRELIARIFENQFSDRKLVDDSENEYAVFALDGAGNPSRDGAVSRISVPQDSEPPELLHVETLNAETVLLTFNEPLDSVSATRVENYQIDAVPVQAVQYDATERTVRLTTRPHRAEQTYQLQLKNIRDLARRPNQYNSGPIAYRYELIYEDRFETNTLENYEFVHLEGPTKQCRRYYDPKTQRIQVLVGDDSKIQFGHRLPNAEKGKFQITFMPQVKYPSGGVLSLVLKQDDENYLKLFNTDGYGVGSILKVVDGEVVDSLAFAGEYRQNQEYPLTLDFSAGEFRAEAFGETVLIQKDQTPLQIHRFEVELVQQDAFFGEILFRGE